MEGSILEGFFVRGVVPVGVVCALTFWQHVMCVLQLLCCAMVWCSLDGGEVVGRVHSRDDLACEDARAWAWSDVCIQCSMIGFNIYALLHVGHFSLSVKQYIWHAYMSICNGLYNVS